LKLKIDSNYGTTVIEQDVKHIPKPTWRNWLIGRPLQTADAPHQTIGKTIGLAVFASDALSSTAYATQEIMMVLAIAGSGALGYVFPVSMAIVILMTWSRFLSADHPCLPGRRRLLFCFAR